MVAGIVEKSVRPIASGETEFQNDRGMTLSLRERGKKCVNELGST